MFGIKWSPLGSYFTLPRYGGKVAIFDTVQRRQILEADNDDFGEVVGWLDDDTVMVHAGADGRVSAVDVAQGTRTLLFTLKEQWSQVSLSPDTRYVVASHGVGGDYGLHVVRVTDGSVMLHDPDENPTSVHWLPNNATVSYARQGGFVVAPLP